MEGYNIIRQNAIPLRHSPYQKSFAALQSPSGVAVLYCGKGDHHAKSTQSVTTTIPDVRQYLTTNKTMKKNEMRNATKMNHMRARTLRHEFQKESNHWNPATTFTPLSASGTPCSRSG